MADRTRRRMVWAMEASTDKEELAELLAVLSSAVDRADRERIASCYTEDSFDDHGTFKGTGREFADFVSRPGPMRTMHHLIGQSIFEVDGDEAWGETFYDDLASYWPASRDRDDPSYDRRRSTDDGSAG
jgi:hypothetical protein